MLSVHTWRMLDPSREAMRRFAEERFAAYSYDGPDCSGAMATPTRGAPNVFVINCSNGFKVVEVSGSEGAWKGRVTGQEQLPYGLPSK
jgi:hypothetical protein